MKTSLSRRTFLKSAATAALASSWSARSWSQVAGANGDLRLVVVGLNGKGRDHYRSLQALPGVRVVAICDVDTAVLDRARATAAQDGHQVDTAVDLRRLLERDDIDGVTLATPNHLHALQAIWTLQAGKDVMVEKPVSHNLWEGAQLVAAERKYGRMVEVNLQNRSSLAIAEALEWTRAGHLGKVTLVRGIVYKRRTSIGKVPGPVAPPSTVDYDLFMGPAPLAPLRRANFHYDWHWQWATGNGDMIAQGNHQLDVGRRFLGDPGHPTGVLSLGGRFGYDDDGETPNTLLVQYDYDVPFLFEVRGLPSHPDALSGDAGGPSGLGAAARAAATMDRYRGINVGNVIECEGGYLVVPSGKYDLVQAFDTRGTLLREFTGIENHYANFVRVMRERKRSSIRASAEQGHLSCALAHFANISYLTGRKLGAGAIHEQLTGRSHLGESYGRFREHLAANEVLPEKTPTQLGAGLQIDPVAERFVGENSVSANALRSRDYRAPYVVPQLT